jgi:DNA-binding transcriptional regulator LsrR (DeoR family)
VAAKRKSIPPFMWVQIAKRHIVEGTPQKELAAEHSVSDTMMTRMIGEVLEKRWLLVSARENYPSSAVVDEESSRELTRRYDNVAMICVLDLKQPHKEYAIWSDHAHRSLGHYLGAKYLRNAITTDDRIGVSSGRGVYHTIEGIYPDLLRAENVTLMSLTGSFGNRGHSAHDSKIMDGDTNVGLFGQVFGKMVHLQTTGREVVVPDNKPRPPWFSDPPGRALIGLGVLEETSRIVSKDSTLRGLEGDLQNLKALTKEASSDDYIPCADMCNYLLYIPPPPGRVHRDAELRHLIDKINARLYVMPFQDLLRVKNCWLAVGGPTKARALHYCLTQGLQVGGLCIDKSLAEELRRLSA